MLTDQLAELVDDYDAEASSVAAELQPYFSGGEGHNALVSVVTALDADDFEQAAQNIETLRAAVMSRGG